MKTNYFIAIFIAALLLNTSCSQDDDMTNQNNDLASLEENYEATLKGYQITGSKDESSPSLDEETKASEEYITNIQKEIEESFSKVSTRAYSNDEGYVGVLKYTTCGSYKEFRYHQDHEDGGGTWKTGDIGTTYIDGNGNTEWRFCIVPGSNSTSPGYKTLRNYGGGVLCLNNYVASEGDYCEIAERYHDDEDSKNKNSIKYSGGLTFTNGELIGRCKFNSQGTLLTWLFNKEGAKTNLGFKYGVITNNTSSSTSIFIDDENRKNASYLKYKRVSNGKESDYTNAWLFGVKGVIALDGTTKYYIDTYTN